MGLYDEIEKQVRANEIKKQIRAAINEGNFYIMRIGGKQSFSYTIGLHQLYKHPEILMCCPGQSLNGAEGILRYMGNKVKKGQQYKDGEKYKDKFWNNYFSLFKTIDPKFYPDYLGTTIGVYKNSSFPAIQCLVPDKQGRLPSDPDCDKGIREIQILRTSGKRN
jgi:hypothetical protein